MTNLKGLADPVLDSQAVFRAVLSAMARPGRVVAVPAPLDVPAPLPTAAAALCLTMVDFETPVWVDVAAPDVVAYLRFHCGADIVEAPGAARFALITCPSRIPPLGTFEAGSDERPDRSATLVVSVETIEMGTGHRLTGPGVNGEVRLRAGGLPERFWPEWRANHERFPRGVDVLLAAGPWVAGLPRSTQVEG